MVRATHHLVGIHDFASLGKPTTPNGKTVRHIIQAFWSKSGNYLFFDIKANAFLYRMVRTIVGTLVRVGLNRLTVQEFENILRRCHFGNETTVAPACGLCLLEVSYPDSNKRSNNENA